MDYGICKGKSKSTNLNCNNCINKNETEFCLHHETKQVYEALNNRSDFLSRFTNKNNKYT